VGRLDLVAVRPRFAARRSLVVYQQLRAAAQAAGCWRAEREPALVLLRADARQRQQSWHGSPVLFDALLDRGDVDAAWRAAAETHAHDLLRAVGAAMVAAPVVTIRWR
jgi:hypothetical protein